MERGTVSAEVLSRTQPMLLRSYSAMEQTDWWRHLATSAILILGAPRSGTTWLAKIIDSHPDVLYRHEPDEIADDAALPPAEQVSLWLRQRAPRAAAKRPLFPKSWRGKSATAVRTAVLAGLSLAQRLPGTQSLSRAAVVPDLLPRRHRNHIRGAVKVVNRDGGDFARALPDLRCMLILRHPCGQIASLLAGWTGGRFGSDGGAPERELEAGAAYAAAAGIPSGEFEALPLAGRLAWAWRAFNETAVSNLEGKPNGRVVIYEALCHQPAAIAQDLFQFAGLAWHPQTSSFLQASTADDRSSGFYDVFRVTSTVADRWRQTLPVEDQTIIKAIAGRSPLANHWPDLVGASAALS